MKYMFLYYTILLLFLPGKVHQKFTRLIVLSFLSIGNIPGTVVAVAPHKVLTILHFISWVRKDKLSGNIFPEKLVKSISSIYPMQISWRDIQAEVYSRTVLLF
ncbi:hypothetical protein L6164_003655 [Bauhinia variegata]|uniref:Uncharacterized protein n=1 Tax=Bauhinia variegata TaxID=167791 RepID=A0ACB9Q1D5_BAUVA|nr:hypothetical protein L6164_003655 [Bauhinia variegata]